MLEIQFDSPNGTKHQFNLIGTVDVEAVSALDTLYNAVAEQHSVELDFSLVQRVNSMGLAQLLKLFEHWQKRKIQIQVTNTNRMIGVLFKMTGLTRFLSDEAVPETKMPELSSAIQVNTQQKTKDGTLALWVHAQNSHQLSGWYFFNTYLQRQLDRDIRLELVHGAINEQEKRMEDMDIVFTRPFEATRLLIENRYQPMMCPIEQADEVTLVVRSDDTRKTLADFQGAKVVTAAPDNFVYLLGRFLLETDPNPASHLDYIFSGHDIKALQMLLKGNADILFMQTETYNGLSSLTKKMLRVLDQSETAFTFHLFCAAPHCVDIGHAISEVLLNMGKDSQGRQILADLGIEGWCKPKADEINMLAMLFNRYANTPEQRKAM